MKLPVLLRKPCPMLPECVNRTISPNIAFKSAASPVTPLARSIGRLTLAQGNARAVPVPTAA